MEMKTIELNGRVFAEKFVIPMTSKNHIELRYDTCFVYINKGKKEIQSPMQKMSILTNEATLLKCGNYIVDVKVVDENEPFEGVAVHFHPGSIKEAFGDYGIDFLKLKKGETMHPLMKIDKSELIDNFISSLDPYFDNPQLVNDRIISAKLQELVVILSENGNNEQATQLLGTVFELGQFDLDAMMEAKMYENISIGELAHLANKSESTFKRDFKKYYNVSPAKYVKSKKLEKAHKLLFTTELGIAEIAFDVGFESLSHFSSSFTKEFGKAPGEYRKKNFDSTKS